MGNECEPHLNQISRNAKIGQNPSISKFWAKICIAVYYLQKSHSNPVQMGKTQQFFREWRLFIILHNKNLGHQQNIISACSVSSSSHQNHHNLPHHVFKGSFIVSLAAWHILRSFLTTNLTQDYFLIACMLFSLL